MHSVQFASLIVAGGLGLALILLLACLADMVELVQLRALRQPAPLPRPQQVDGRSAFISIHVPIHNEPADMVIRTLKSLLALDWTEYEVIVLDNNTTDDRLWRPVDQFCAQHPSRLRFFHCEGVQGFKAGALNLARQFTDPRASFIAVLDADYMVTPDFLRTLVPLFADGVDFVQAPQDYSLVNVGAWQRWAYREYARFFAVGMPLRSRHNALHLHGTMTLIRKSASEAVGEWDGACLTEDCEYGVRLLASSSKGIYVERSLGRGLLPPAYVDYLRQRRRWVVGGAQTLRTHAPLWWRGASLHGQLTPVQRFYYLQGWLPWFRDFLLTVAAAFVLTSVWLADRFLINGVVAAVASAILIAFGAIVAKEIVTLRVHMRTPWSDALGSLLLVVTLIPTIGWAWWLGWTTRKPPFRRTPKCAALSQWSRTGASLELLVAILAVGTAAAGIVRGSLTGLTAWTVALVAATALARCALHRAVACRDPVQDPYVAVRSTDADHHR